MRRVELRIRVRSVADVTGRMREIELAGPDLPRLRPRPGAHLVVHVPARRVYSIWRHDPRAASLVIRVAVHDGGGPGCDWARSVAVGDRVTVEPPRSKITLADPAAFHLFAGDETAAVPLLAMHAALHRATRGAAVALGVFEAAEPGDEVPGAPSTPALPWVHRGTASPVASRVLLRAVQELELPPGRGVAYIAGETETCRLLQRHLIEARGFPRRSVLTQPQWAPSRPGFGAGGAVAPRPSGPPGRHPRAKCRPGGPLTLRLNHSGSPAGHPPPGYPAALPLALASRSGPNTVLAVMSGDVGREGVTTRVDVVGR